MKKFALMLAGIAIGYFALDWLSMLSTRLVPKYEEYASSSTHKGAPASLILDTNAKREIQARLNDALKRPANFAGDHVIAAWGCEPACTCGAVVSLKTGQVEMLPKICNWNEEGYRLGFRSDSRLIVASGYIDNKGVYGKHYYEFTGGRLRHVFTMFRNRPD